MITPHLEAALLARIGAGRSLERALPRDKWVNAIGPEGTSLVETLLRENVYTLPVKWRHTVARNMLARARVALEGAPPDSDGRHWVYRLYSHTGVLLYVGTTDRGPLRLVEHHRSKPWFAHVYRVEIERYRERVDALTREVSLIRGSRPVYNVTHNQEGATL